MKAFYALMIGLILGTGLLGAQAKELVVGSDFDYVPWEYMNQGNLTA